MLKNDELTTLMAIARKVWNSGVAPKECTNEDAVFAVMLAGVEYGVEPMQALHSIHIIKGRLSLKSDFVAALCARAPVCKYFRLVAGDAERATFETLREGHAEPTRLTYTLGQAQRAGLTKNPQWTSHPEAMLRARAQAALGRLVYPDLVGGVVIPDEAEEIAANDNAPRPALRQLASATESPELPAPAEPAPSEPAPLAAYRTRLARCASSDELVAVRLALRPSLSALEKAALEKARELTAARARELFGNTDDFNAAVAEAERVSKDPAHWSVVAEVLGGLAAASTVEATRAVVAQHAQATTALPEALKTKLSAVLRARRAALATPPTEVAAALEADLRAADGIPALDEVAEKIETAAKAGTITREQAGALARLYDQRVAELEREPSTDEAAA